jgi:hypothetical protein
VIGNNGSIQLQDWQRQQDAQLRRAASRGGTCRRHRAPCPPRHLPTAVLAPTARPPDVHEPGELTSRLTSDCYAISRCIATNVNVALRNLLQVIGAARGLRGGH